MPTQKRPSLADRVAPTSSPLPRRALGQTPPLPAAWARAVYAVKSRIVRPNKVPWNENQLQLFDTPNTKTAIREKIKPIQHLSNSNLMAEGLTKAGLIRGVRTNGTVVATKELEQLTQERVDFLNKELIKEERIMHALPGSAVTAGDKGVALERAEHIKELRGHLTPIFRGALQKSNLNLFLHSLDAPIQVRETRASTRIEEQ